MDLKYYFSVIWRRKWVIFVVLATAFVITVVGQRNTAPVYNATTTIRVAISLGMTQNSQLYTYNSQLINTFVALSTSRPVMKELAERLHIQRLPIIQVAVVPNTELIRITSSASDPALAASTSNALAQILIEQNVELFAGGGLASSEILSKQVEAARLELNKVRAQYQLLLLRTPIPPGSTPTAPTQPPAAPDEMTVTNLLLQEKQRTYEALLREYEEAQYREALSASMITVVEEAIAPRVPSEPRVALNITLGLLSGLFAGLMLAFIFENTDQHLHNDREIEETVQRRAIAKLPRATRKQLFIYKNPSTVYAESVRLLAAHAHFGELNFKHNVLTLAGADFRQGTSTIIANFGFALAEQGKSIVIVDFNGRNPCLHTIFDLPLGQGITEVVAGELDIMDALQKVGSGNLSLLSFGAKAAAPFQTLDVNGMAETFKTLRQKFDLVLVDAPPLVVADVVSIAPHTDEIIMVARCNHIKGHTLRSASEFLSRFKDNKFNLIINEAKIN